MDAENNTDNRRKFSGVEAHVCPHGVPLGEPECRECDVAYWADLAESFERHAAECRKELAKARGEP